MSVSAPVARVLERIASGESVTVACVAEGVRVQSDVMVDAHYDGKPVCTVTLPWVIDGYALLFADETVAAAIAEGRLAAMASALAMPVCILRHVSAPAA
jgi:hypothetical protein